MDFIHEFWVEMFPMFSEYGFIYVFLDFLTVYVMLYAIVVLPGRLLLGGSSKVWND